MEEVIKMSPRYRVPVVEKKKHGNSKTHEEYVKELKLKNPTVEVTGEYINSKIKIEHHCLIHDIYWNISPSNALNGNGCSQCHKERLRHSKIRTDEQYIEELKIANPNTIPLENYMGANVSILHLCKIHNIKCNITPTRALLGYGCKECHVERIKKSNTKSHEQYVYELSIKNPIIEVVEPYINSHTKIKHHCLIHDEYWNTSPDCALQGYGCSKCHGERLRDALVKSNEEYISELETKNPYVTPVENYITVNTPILHRCLIHNICWETTPASVLQGCGCIDCGKEKLHNSNVMTHEEYILRLSKITSTIDVLEKYINSWTPILHKCLIDGHEWLSRPSNILWGYGCPICAGNIQKTHEQYIKEVFDIHPNIKIIGTYITARIPIEHECLIDNYRWYASPSSILRGSGCPKCGGTMKRTHEEYVSIVSLINPDIEIVGRYINAHTPILHKCKIDRNEWCAEPNNVINGKGGCPQCHESSGERMVRQWLEKNNINYVFQKHFVDCVDINTLPFDFYLPNYNICIEYDGEQHFVPKELFGGQRGLEYIQKHDNIKNEYCKNKGISLLRIPYYKNVEEELNNFLFI